MAVCGRLADCLRTASPAPIAVGGLGYTKKAAPLGARNTGQGQGKSYTHETGEGPTMSTIIAEQHDLHSKIAIDPYHLGITKTYPLGSTYRIHVIQDGDLGVGSKEATSSLNHAVQGRVVVALGVDDDHDAVFFDLGDADAVETLRRTVETLQAAVDALSRVSKA